MLALSTQADIPTIRIIINRIIPTLNSSDYTNMLYGKWYTMTGSSEW